MVSCGEGGGSLTTGPLSGIGPQTNDYDDFYSVSDDDFYNVSDNDYYSSGPQLNNATSAQVRNTRMAFQI